MTDDVKLTFVQESEELLEQMEDALLAMEEAPDDDEHLNSVFRAMHTIKGAAGIFGFDFIVAFTHPVETVMDHVRSGERGLDADTIALLLQCKDHTSNLVRVVAEGDENAIPQDLLDVGEDILQRLSGQPEQETEAQALTHAVTLTHEVPLAHEITKVHEEKATVDVQPKCDTCDDTWLISLDFQSDALRNGIDPLSFIRYLQRMGTITDIATLTHRQPPIENFDPESCYLSFRIALQTSSGKEDIESVFEFAADDCEIRILPPHSKQVSYLKLLEELPEGAVQKLGEILVHVGAITEQELQGALNEQENAIDEAVGNPEKGIKPLGEILVERNVVSQPVVSQALKKQEVTREKASKEAHYIRVDANRLGQLINLVGELVISNAAVKLMVDKYDIQEATEVVAGVENLVEEIRDNALQLRMVQIGDTFSRFRRVVRDVSKELGKDIELVITGGEAELDKTVVEKINDPLTHLIRNSLDHGIERPDDREAKGKPRKGTLRLNALHDSGHIVIQIADDGAGLDVEKIRAKAIANGLITAEQTLTHRELMRLIFEPGLSTKEQASNLSGRGVGMDVVRRNIDELRGSVEVESEVDKGTLVTIHLPLTLAIIDGFMVGTGDERYVIPLSMVEECVEMDAYHWGVDEKRHYVNLRGDVMPYIRLGDFFNVPRATTHTRTRESLVVVRFGRTRAGLVVDQLFGELQTVIKPLGKVFQGLQGVSGATVLGSGDIALILDVQGLITLATHKNEREPLVANQI
ncbi:chemotaxis protein CheA [Enterovibrio paralichthyis]|uniref:chemotaxis protein CheA n=1 Tax=Enterovibrio paralichthyis TaxID=2853805 RepID=UPI001C44015B|nr:chemotaxis protein CheA [Enterovibrio paralichthyis]MBV7296957.1 chemotaxis protein CheA [Enterovibrio paralichthyis]